MKCIDKKFIAVNENDPVRHFNFEEFEHIPTKTNYLLVPGGHHWWFYDQYYKNNVVLLYFEDPNSFFTPGELDRFHKHRSKFIKIYSICPHSTDYFNKLYGDNQRESIWIPFNEKNIPEQKDKIFDVFYSGNIISCPFNLNFLNIYNKKCIVSSDGRSFYSGVNYKEKLKLNAQSKVSIVHNILHSVDSSLTNKYPTHKGLQSCNINGLAPQLKMRCIEAAVSKSLMLCFYDQWKLIERQFIPNIDFIYWYNIDDLIEKINHVLNNYEMYLPMIDNAYKKVKDQWNTKNFYDQYLKNL